MLRARLPNALPRMPRRAAARAGRTARRDVGASLVSVAGLVGARVANQGGEEVGRIDDVVARWTGLGYPPLTGLVLRVGRRRAFVPIADVAELGADGARLGTARLDLRDFARREGEVVLAGDVIDRQLVDTDGIRVIRAADLYLAGDGEAFRLVGVDVSLRTLLRRLGPARARRRALPAQVIDWSVIEPFDEPGRSVRLRGSGAALARLRPAELADVLEELGRAQRQQALERLAADQAADVLEEMEDEEAAAVILDAPPERAAALLAGMEPDEAADVLRDMPADRRERLLAALPAAAAAELGRLAAFDDDEAGGAMTSAMARARLDETVADVRARLAREPWPSVDLDRVIVVDEAGVLVDEVTLLELFLAAPESPLRELCAPPWPVTVRADASLPDVLERFIANRGSSIVVVDDAGRPLGRILADDLVDALVERSGSLRRRIHGR